MRTDLEKAGVWVDWPEVVACWIVGAACVGLGLSFLVGLWMTFVEWRT